LELGFLLVSVVAVA